MARLALPFLSDERPDDRNLGRIALGVPVAFVAGGVAALAAGLLAIVLFTWIAFQIGAAGDGPMVGLEELFQNPEVAAADLRLSLTLLSMVAAVNGAFAAVAVLVGGMILKRRYASYFTAATRFRWGLVLFGALAHAALLGPLVVWQNWAAINAGQFPLFTMTPEMGLRVFYVAFAAVTLFIAALAEEILFRGWLLRHVSALLRNPLIAVVLTSVIFSAIHGELQPAPFLARVVMGAGFAWMTLRLGGVELATGAHMANNLILAALVQPLTAPSGGGATLTPGDFIDLGAYALTYLAATEAAVRLFPFEPREPSAAEEAASVF